MTNYFEPYFTGLKFCNAGLSDTTCGTPVSAAGRNYILNDNTGMAFVFQYDRKGYVIVDTNGARGPNKMGRDVFYFNIMDDGRVIPFGWVEGVSREDIINGYYNSSLLITIACNNNGGQYDKYACTWLIMEDDWQIAPDYPW